MDRLFVAAWPDDATIAALSSLPRADDDIGEPPRPRFRGHLTLARTRGNATPSLLGHPFEATFAIREVAVVRSDLTAEGARYETVATVPTVTAG